jgi:23S rRNA pseudouridine1911/1915/1917 synthase
VLDILYEDNHLLAVNKPAGIATMGVRGESLVTLAREYIKREHHKPGNVYLGVVSRLDIFTSGVVLFARTSKAAARLTEQFRSRRVQKTYWAILDGRVQPTSGRLEDWLRKDEARQRMMVVDRTAAGALQAELSYRLLRTIATGSLVEIDLHSGRKHQIRVQFAARGWPVCGERKYARARPFDAGLALHARRLIVEHPTTKEPVDLVAPLPRSWPELGPLS